MGWEIVFVIFVKVINKDQILARIKSTVAETDPRATVILYGSYARGDYNEESDIDVLILVDKEKVTLEDRMKISYPLYDLQFEVGILISPFVYSREAWTNPEIGSFFQENVNKDGIVL